MKRLSLLIFFCFFLNNCFSQDSVKVYQLIHKSKNAQKITNSTKAIHFAHEALEISKKTKFLRGELSSNNQLGSIYESLSNYDSSEYFLNKTIQLAPPKNYNNEIAEAHNLIGFVLWHKSQYKEAMPHHTLSLSLFTKTQNEKGVANSFARIGNVYYDLSDFPKSLDNFLQSLKHYMNLRDSSGIAEVCNYIGKVYSRLNEYESSKKYLFKALGLNQRLKNNRGTAISYNGLGNLFMDSHDLIKALKFFEKSKEHHVLGGDQIGISVAYINIATVYDMMSSLSKDSLKIISANISYNSKNSIVKSLSDSSRKYFLHSIEINERVGNQFGLIYGYNGVGDVFFKLKEYDAAIPHFKTAYKISSILNAVSEKYESAKRLSLCYEKIHNQDSSFHYLKTYVHIKEEVIGEERQRELFRKESQYEYDKKLQKQKLIRQAQQAMAAEKQKRQLLIIIAVVFVLIIVVVFAIILNKRLRTTRLQKQLIEQQKISIEIKNKEIIDSITYAKRIQDAMLTSQSYIEHELAKYGAESFIVFKPKDIVSGDFYWFHIEGDELFYMTADSTGHGVPGGFMSMLGINLLSEIVVERKIKDPGTVLNLMRDEIIKSLKTDDGFSKDGMDGVFCKINFKTKVLEYAASNNPFYIVSNETLNEYKSQKMPIGYMEKIQPFETKRVNLIKGDVIYSFTDGYADQFGGEKGKKYKYSQLKNVFISINSLSTKLQKTELEKSFETWKGVLEQVDDVCIIGIRL
jgi:serine phosphatase RsbU (regulator of sigma subunit)